MVTHLTDRQPAFERDIERRLWLAEQGLAAPIVLTGEEAAALQRSEKGSAATSEKTANIRSVMQNVWKGVAGLFPQMQGRYFIRKPIRPLPATRCSPPR